MTSNSANIVDMDAARTRHRNDLNEADKYKNAGAHLASVREAHGLTLDEAASRTHIKSLHLSAIENLDVHQLPARPYAIGFVKTYAEFLGLDPRPIVERFKIDAEYNAPLEVPVEKFEAAAEAEAGGDNHDLSLIAVAAIMIFIIWCAWQIMRPHDVRMIGEASTIVDPLRAVDATLSPAFQETSLEPVTRVEPVYPINCAQGADPAETVAIVFGVSASGRVFGEKVATSTNACFEGAALNALRRWEFEPPEVEGAKRALFDQRIVLEFVKPS